MIPALQITAKPALGDHPFVKLKVVVAQNRWSLNEVGSIRVYYYAKCVLLRAGCATLKRKVCNIKFLY